MNWKDGWEMILVIFAGASLIVTYATYKMNKIQKRRNFFFKRMAKFESKGSDAINSVMKRQEDSNRFKAPQILDRLTIEGSNRAGDIRKNKTYDDIESGELSNGKAQERNFIVALEHNFFQSALAPDMIVMKGNGRVKRIKYNFFRTIIINGNKKFRSTIIADCLNEIIDMFDEARKNNYSNNFQFFVSTLQNISTEVANITKGFIQLPYDKEAKLITPKNF